MDQYQDTDIKVEVMSDKHSYSTEDARDTLDRIIGFIGNCDTKASIMLGIFSVVVTIMITDATLIKLNLIIKSVVKSSTLMSAVFLIMLCVSSIVFLIGVITIASVLFANTNISRKDSKIYFVDIALNKNSNTFKEKVVNQSEHGLLDDLITQIYINSVICYKKFKRYNLGVVIALTSLISMVILFLIGILMFEVN